MPEPSAAAPPAAAPPGRQDISRQLELILSSPSFRDSAIQSRLLRFLLQCHLEGRGHELKESFIAIEVFGRPGDFDGRSDNTVRMSVSRLRSRLAAFYSSESSPGDVLIEVPRGSYAPIVRWRQPLAPPAPPPRRQIPFWAGLALLAAGLAAGWAASAFRSRLSHPPVPPSFVHSFYSRFWNKPALLIYRNPTFLRMERDVPLLLLYGGHSGGSYNERLPLPSDTPLSIRQRYQGQSVNLANVWTDTGSVEAVFALSRLFSDGNASISLHNTQNITAAQCRDRHLIVVSPPWFNLFVGQLPPLRHFNFDSRDPRISWIASPGQPRSYQAEHEKTSGALRRTWGFAALQPGLSPDTRTLRISGVDPLAVEGAARFMTSDAGLRELARALGNPNALPPTFEVLLRVDSLNGQVAAVHFERGAP